MAWASCSVSAVCALAGKAAPKTPDIAKPISEAKILGIMCGHSIQTGKTTASSLQLIVWDGPFLDVDQGSASREELVEADVRFGSQADILASRCDVRFTPTSRHRETPVG